MVGKVTRTIGRPKQERLRHKKEMVVSNLKEMIFDRDQ